MFHHLWQVFHLNFSVLLDGTTALRPVLDQWTAEWGVARLLREVRDQQCQNLFRTGRENTWKIPLFPLPFDLPLSQGVWLRECGLELFVTRSGADRDTRELRI